MKKKTIQQLPEGLPENIEYLAIPSHTEEWYEYRRNGIGGSEIGYIMGLSPYKSNIQLFYEKIGEHEPSREQNQAMFHGSQLESYIANLWQYYDGTHDGYIQNHDNGQKIREICTIDGFIRNPKYPHLFANVDGIIPKGSVSLATAETLDKPGLLEIKTIGSFYAKLWDDGIPPQYLAQVHQYMMILEIDYCEIAILIDGRYFDVKPVERSERLCEQILEMADHFWFEQVEPARQLLQEKKEHEANKRYDLAEESEAKVHSLEPEADNSEAYKDFMAKKQLLDPIILEGSQEMKNILIKHKYWSKIAKTSEGVKRLYENQARSYLMKNNADKVDFGTDEGYANVSTKKGSDKLVFNNRLKMIVDQDKINDLLEELDDRI